MDSCIVVRYLIDPERDLTVPAGIVLSDHATQSLRFRLPREGEVIGGVCLATARRYLEMAQAQIEGWLRSGTLPYALEPEPPLSPAWWEQVRRLMQWQVRLDVPRLIDCRCPEEEIEALYMAWVRPQYPPKEPEAADQSVERDGGLPPAKTSRAARRRRGKSAAADASGVS